MPTTAELSQQVTDDPNGIGLSWSLANGDIVTLLNQADFGTVEKPNVPGSEIFNAIDPGEYDGLTNKQQERVRWVTHLGDSVDVRSGTNARTVMLDLFGPGTTTRSNLISLVQRQGTYAEVQWGPGTSISLDQVREARP